MVPTDVRRLIRTMSEANPRWGAPRLHGELLKLGIDIGETSVSKYMTRHPKPPSETWRAFLENHVRDLVSVDFFTVPTLRFQVLEEPASAARIHVMRRRSDPRAALSCGHLLFFGVLLHTRQGLPQVFRVAAF